MARTESKTFQCHPDATQGEIDIHQKFHWSLLSSQDVKTVDNSLEQRGNSIYNVRKSEHYVKLTFSRDLDTPNLNEIKKLEEAYYGLPEPEANLSYYTPDTSGTSCFVFIIAVVFMVLAGGALPEPGIVIGIGVVFLIAYFMGVSIWKSNKIKEDRAITDRINGEREQERSKNAQERRRILSEVARYS